jgi:predicted phage terminase large subunit-like protein
VIDYSRLTTKDLMALELEMRKRGLKESPPISDPFAQFIPKPQEGPQTMAMNSSADVIFFGGAAGGGKTTWALAYPLWQGAHLIPGYTGIYFRRSLTEATAPGGLAQAMAEMYFKVGARTTKKPIQAVWKSGSMLQIRQMATDADKLAMQGAEVGLVVWDELTHFDQEHFWFMFSRNRSTATGGPRRILATMNPDPDSWVREMVAWWIDPFTGYAIPERSGVVRYFFRAEDEDGVGSILIWGDTREEIVESHNMPDGSPIDPATICSFTFIASSLSDNKILEEKDPSYRRKLELMPRVERERMLHGNWNIRAGGGDFFKREQFGMVESYPHNLVKVVRRWDLAGTENKNKLNSSPDWTVGIKMGVSNQGVIYVLDVIRLQSRPYEVKQKIIQTAIADGKQCMVVIPEDPGAAGKSVAADYIRALIGFVVKAKRETGEKTTRARVASSQVAAGNVFLVRGQWNEAFIRELEAFPMSPKDDQVDAFDVEELADWMPPWDVFSEVI